jgi:hypothetical protein
MRHLDKLATSRLDPVTIGICLLGLDTLERLGLASGVSAAEILRRFGVEVTDAAVADELQLHYRLLAQKYLEGMMPQSAMAGRRGQ